MPVEVVNVRWHPAVPCVYVGRDMPGRKGHPLANPFRVKNNATAYARKQCLARYLAWLHARPDLAEQLRRLRDQTRDRPLLGCWCGDWPEDPGLVCHAVELAKLLNAAEEGGA